MGSRRENVPDLSGSSRVKANTCCHPGQKVRSILQVEVRCSSGHTQKPGDSPDARRQGLRTPLQLRCHVPTGPGGARIQIRPASKHGRGTTGGVLPATSSTARRTFYHMLECHRRDAARSPSHLRMVCGRNGFSLEQRS